MKKSNSINQRQMDYQIQIDNYQSIKGIIRYSQNQSLQSIRERIQKQTGYRQNNLVVQWPQSQQADKFLHGDDDSGKRLKDSERSNQKVIILRQAHNNSSNNNRDNHRVSRKGTLQQGSIYFQEQSIIERNSGTEQFMYREPQKPPIVIGTIKRCYKFLSCLTSNRIMYLNFQSLKFHIPTPSTIPPPNPTTAPEQTIPLSSIKQISSYRKKQYYFLRILTKAGQQIDCKFEHKQICKQWIYYFHKAVNYSDYLLERKSYSKKESYRNFLRGLQMQDLGQSGDKCRVVRIQDCQNGISQGSQYFGKQGNISSIKKEQKDSKNSSSQNIYSNSHHSNQSQKKYPPLQPRPVTHNPKAPYQQSRIIIKNNHNTYFIRLADFKVTHQIGKGAFSTVYKAQFAGKVYALKQINKDKLIYENQLKYAITELNILKKCSGGGQSFGKEKDKTIAINSSIQSNSSVIKNRCPFIIPLSFAFQTEDYLYLAIKYLPFGTLKNLIQKHKQLPIKQSLSIISEIIVAIEYLHKNNILYRDMKPQNILMTQQGHIYLIDFGLSIQLNDQEQFAESFVGTPLYLAPQRLQGSGKINYKADIYGVGCIFYLMLHGHAPFQAESLASIIYNIKNCQLKIRKDLQNDLIQDFLRKTLQTNVDKRLSHMSSHPLFQKTDWNKMLKKQHQIMTLQPVKTQFCGSNSTGDHDYTEDNYPNKKINDWNYVDQFQMLVVQNHNNKNKKAKNESQKDCESGLAER